MNRIVGHLDMDAFFASVEERDKPYLRGMPVIVGSDPQGGAGRGVVSTANYEARKLGIRSALPIQTAWKYCQVSQQNGGARCVFITSGFEKYPKASKEVFSLVQERVPRIDKVSVDEAYLDLSFCETFQAAERFVRTLQKDIFKQTQLTCSVGVAENKMLAKIASDCNKPYGITVVRPERVPEFLAELPVRSIPGVGKQAERSLLKRGVRTIRDAQAFTWQELSALLGSQGFSLWERVRGIDGRSIQSEPAQRKSIGKHYTFMRDSLDMKEVFSVTTKQAEAIIQSLHAQEFSMFSTVVITVRFSNFNTVTRSLTTDAMKSVRELELKIIKLLLPFFERTENPSLLPIRLVGVRIENLR